MQIKVYRTYRFIDKDPIIDRVKTLLRDEDVGVNDAHVLSGVAATTLHNWFMGDTRKPQHATIAAVVTSLGYEVDFKKVKSLNMAKELEKAADWWMKRHSKKRKRNGRG